MPLRFPLMFSIKSRNGFTNLCCGVVRLEWFALASVLEFLIKVVPVNSGVQLGNSIIILAYHFLGISS